MPNHGFLQSLALLESDAGLHAFGWGCMVQGFQIKGLSFGHCSAKCGSICCVSEETVMIAIRVPLSMCHCGPRIMLLEVVAIVLVGLVGLVV